MEDKPFEKFKLKKHIFSSANDAPVYGGSVYSPGVLKLSGPLAASDKEDIMLLAFKYRVSDNTGKLVSGSYDFPAARKKADELGGFVQVKGIGVVYGEKNFLKAKTKFGKGW